MRMVPLVGLLLGAAPAPAHACDVVGLEGLGRDVRLTADVGREEVPPLPAWCERSDDPRCSPGSHGASTPEVGPTPLIERRATGAVPDPAVHAFRFAPTRGLGPESGIRLRVERPPKG